MERWSFYQLRYNLAAVPAFFVDVKSREKVKLSDDVMMELLGALNGRKEKDGYLNVVTDFESFRMTHIADIPDNHRATILKVYPDWVQLTEELILAPPSTHVPAGSEVLIKKLEEGQTDFEVISLQRTQSKSLSEMREMHLTYYPDNRVAEDMQRNKEKLEAYPDTVGEQRIRIENLKILKPFKQSFLQQVDELKKEYSSWRKSRGDGNCYYRAIAFTYLEHLCRAGINSKLIKEFYMKLYLQKDAFSLRRFNGEFDKEFAWAIGRLRELVEIKEKTGSAVEQLEHIYTKDHEFDRAMVRIMKLATSNHLIDNESSFSQFLQKSLSELISEVLADGIESEGIVFKAVANLLDVVLVHVLLPDTTSTIFKEEFTPDRPGRKPVISLLLRPGHYDILYPLQADFLDRYNFVDEDYSGFDVEVEIGECFQLYKLIA